MEGLHEGHITEQVWGLAFNKVAGSRNEVSFCHPMQL
jgi:hypothetical protein